MIKNRLSKVFSVLLITTICLLGVFSANADDGSYTISEINDMHLTLPDNVVSVTRSSSANDEYFSLFGLDYNTTMNNLENSNIYLQGMDKNSTYTVTVTMTETQESQEMANYNLLQADKLSEVTNNFLSQNEFTECTPDSSGDVVWLYLAGNVSSNGSTINTYQANTVYDGKNINIIIQRNGADVNASDYELLQSITSSVNFKQADSSSTVILFVIIGFVVILIILIIFFVTLIRHIRHKKKKNNNNKIIEELADKYTRPRKQTSYYDEDEPDSDESDDKADDFVNISYSDDMVDDEDSDNGFFDGVDMQNSPDYDEQVSDVSYSEEEIDEILGYHSKATDENEGVVIVDNTTKADFTEAELIQAEAEPEPDAENAEESSEQADVSVVEDENSESDEETAEELEEFEEYSNDEDLVREDAKHTKFNNGYDFFDEAPKKSFGVISSKEIEDAEDYDVINEVEQRVSEVEKQTPNSGDNFADTLKKIGNGFKSFFTHCGYFITNISRMIKHNRAVKKRRKAEEERRRRAEMRAERQRARRKEAENNGLVQVHRRTDSRPNSNRTTNRQTVRTNGTSTKRTAKRPTNQQNNRQNNRRR